MKHKSFADSFKSAIGQKAFIDKREIYYISRDGEIEILTGEIILPVERFTFVNIRYWFGRYKLCIALYLTALYIKALLGM